jgi:flagella basal body P-ring formation protein FlgA
MNSRLFLVLLWFAPFAPAQAPACVSVRGDRILASDLGSSIPSFREIAPGTPLAASPLPGVRRVFRFSELALLAKRYSVELDAPADLCVERSMEKLDRGRMLESMRATLGIADVRIEIIDASAYPVPMGRIEFQREGLHAPASRSARTPVEWRGNVVYSENRRFSIWARVVILATLPRVVAVQNLARGEPISALQVRAETADLFPDTRDVTQTVDQVVGRIPWRNIPEGTEIRLSQTTAPLDVCRGDLVEVDVRSGAARLSLTAKAESGGRSGETITLRNLSSNKVFQARVAGKGKVSVGGTNGQEN